MPQDVALSANWPLCQALTAHARALATRPPATVAADTAGPLIDTLHRVTYFLYYTGRVGPTVALAGRALALAGELLGPAHPDTLTARGNLAGSYWSAGRTTEAIPLAERVLADAERLLGPDHTDTLRARGNLAASYSAAGRTTEAIALERR
jgi:hypothetical protein